MELSFLGALHRAGKTMRGRRLAPIVGIGRALARRAFRDVSLQVDDFSMTSSFGQRAFLHDLAAGVNFDPFQCELFKKSVRPGNIVLDIGAHIGWYTLQAARVVGSAGRVYAFEPDPQNYSTLVQNVQRNGLGERVILTPRAVCDKPGPASLFIDGTSEGVRSSSSLVAIPPEMQGKMRVECVTIDDFLDTSVAVDIVKMDIEGAELKALRGMERTLARSGIHLVVFVECNPGALRAADSTAGDLLKRLEELGFIVMVIDERTKSLCPPALSSIEDSLYTNLLCVRERRMLESFLGIQA